MMDRMGPPVEMSSLKVEVNWWTQANYGQMFKPNFIDAKALYVCFDGPMFLFPLLKSHVE